MQAYKGLAHVERAFRSCKSIHLKVRPIFDRPADRVRVPAFLCTPAYCVEWYVRRALAPLPFDDQDAQAAERRRADLGRPPPAVGENGPPWTRASRRSRSETASWSDYFR